MTLWRPPERSDALPVSFWQSLGRYNYGGDVLVEDGLWHAFLDRLERRRGEWIKVRVIDVIAGTEEEVLRRFLSGASDLRTRLVLVCAAA